MHGLPACLQSPQGSSSQKGAPSLSIGQVPASAPPAAGAADRLAAKPAEPSREAHLGRSRMPCLFTASLPHSRYLARESISIRHCIGHMLRAEAPLSVTGLYQKSGSHAGCSLVVM